MDKVLSVSETLKVSETFSIGDRIQVTNGSEQYRLFIEDGYLPYLEDVPEDTIWRGNIEKTKWAKLVMKKQIYYGCGLSVQTAVFEALDKAGMINPIEYKKFVNLCLMHI